VRRFRFRSLLVVSAFVVLAAQLLGLGLPQSAGAAAKAPITIGIACSCTGPLGPGIIVSPPGFQAWAKYENAHGGLNGHQISVVLMDDASNTGTALTNVETMISQDHISVLVDDSEGDTAFQSYVDQHHIPVIGGSSTSDLFLSDPNWFSPGETVDTYFLFYMAAAKKLGEKTVGQFYCAESTICQQGVPSFRADAKADGLSVGYVSSISYAAPNYTAQCLAAKQAGVQVLNVADAAFVAERVGQNCETQSYDPWYVAGGAAIAGAFPTSPGFENHFLGAEDDIPYFDTAIPGVKLFVNEMKKYYPSVLTNPNYTDGTIQNWITGLVLAQAVKASNAGSTGPITPAEIYKGLYTFHDQTLGGMAPPLTYKKGQPNPVHCWFWIKAQNGKFTTPYGLQPNCVNPPK
jgi:branched-chain amino acid transport system substrate-binding protein